MFINPKSGGLWGRLLLPIFRFYLHPIQVVNLNLGSPEKALKNFESCKKFRILVCGGDISFASIQEYWHCFFIDCTAVLAGSSLRSKNSISRTLLPLLFFHWVQEMIYQELFIGDQAILYALYNSQNSLGKRSNQGHIKVYWSFAWYILSLFILIE